MVPIKRNDVMKGNRRTSWVLLGLAVLFSTIVLLRPLVRIQQHREQALIVSTCSNGECVIMAVFNSNVRCQGASPTSKITYVNEVKELYVRFRSR
jgi:hypothetical protein